MPGTLEQAAWDPAEAADLRRRHRREVIDTVLDAAEHLPRDDRALVEAVYRDGRRVSELAALTGDGPRVVSRRIKRLVARVLSPRYAFVALHAGEWSPTRQRVASACVLGGRSLREAADELSMSLHAVRRHHDAVNALFEAKLRAATGARAPQASGRARAIGARA